LKTQSKAEPSDVDRNTWRMALITIGFRAAPTEVTFAIYDSEASAIQNVDSIKIPSAFRWPDSLKYVRSNLLDVLREYRVEKAGIRLTETNAKSVSYERNVAVQCGG
jgi:hypothetical protein